MFISTMRKVTGDNLDYLKAPVAYAVLEGVFVAAPFGILVLMLPDMLRGHLDMTAFWCWYAVLLFFFAVRTLLSLKSYRGGMFAGYKLGAAIRLQLGEHLRKLSMGFFSERNTGELVNRLFFNVGLVEMMLGHFLTQAVTNVITSVSVLAVLLWVFPTMGVVAVAPLLVGFPLLWGLIRLVGGEVEKRHRMIDNVNSFILEYLHGIVVFKAFNVTGMGFKRLEKALEELRRFSIRFEVKGFTVALSYVAILELGFLVLIFAGVALVRDGRLGVPETVAFLVVGLRVYRPLHRFAENASLTRAAFNGVRAIEEVFDNAPIEGDDVSPPSDFAIRFDAVGFGYGVTKVVEDVSFTVQERSMTALVGPSGSGKSTLVKLVARFWDADRGRISIGGRDIRTMAPDVLLGNISMVFQDVYLFQDTILNNIRIGNDKAGRDEVIEVAHKARCHDLIMGLPQGYDTVIGEGGATLSGGEKQRISIARAMLKNAPIVLLDEATAALDPENDRLVQMAIDDLVKSKTLLVIAHRLHTVTAADQIVVLDRGRVVQKGRHEDLCGQDGLYARLWREQQDPVGFQPGRK